MFFLFLQAAPDLYHAWEEKKEGEKLSIILKPWNLGKKILIITTKCLDTVIQSIEDV